MYQSSLLQSTPTDSSIRRNHKGIFNDSTSKSTRSKSINRKEGSLFRPSVTLSRPTILNGETNEPTILNLEGLQLSANGRFEKSPTGKRTKSSPIKIQLMDRSEIDMLRSINNSEYTSSTYHSSTRQMTPGRLHRHEFDDSSPEDESNVPLRHCRSAGIRATEDPSIKGGKIGERASRKNRSTSAVTTRNEMIKLEERGNRMKKGHNTSTTTARSYRSTNITQDHLQKLIYDSDFDCYYDPVHERYYKITRM